MTIYTMETWKQAGIFNADPGQEITAEVYYSMLNELPPEELPAEKARQALKSYGLPIHNGFLMGDPAANDNKGPVYHAFGFNDYGKGKHYYYIGLSHKEERRQGMYYYFDCLTDIGSDNIKPAENYKDDRAAIQAAADLEATLYKVEYKNGRQVNEILLYEPQYF